MESFWKKELVDGTIELGTDTMVSLGQASWTKGRQDIQRVMLHFAGKIVWVRADRPEQCKWRLLDRNTCSAMTGENKRVERFLEVSFGDHKMLRRWDLSLPGPQTFFEFHLNDWLGIELSGHKKVLFRIGSDGTLSVEYK